MRKQAWLFTFSFFLGSTLSAHAQNEPGWTFSGRFQGSSSSSGVVLKADPSVGYVVNPHFETYVGMPVYFVKESVSTTTTNGFMNGIGNAYVGMRLNAAISEANFASNLVVTAPTGDRDKGFSTGRVTGDWTNTLSGQLSAFTAFGSAGIANTVSDTSFFVRPFSSLGLVSHFDGGAILPLSPFIEVGASGYAVRGSGQQRIFSKVIRSNSGPSENRGKPVFETNTETVGTSEIANDHGASTWLAIRTRSRMSFEIGYTRSVPYQLNTVFFGAGFRMGK